MRDCPPSPHLFKPYICKDRLHMSVQIPYALTSLTLRACLYLLTSFLAFMIWEFKRSVPEPWCQEDSIKFAPPGLINCYRSKDLTEGLQGTIEFHQVPRSVSMKSEDLEANLIIPLLFYFTINWLLKILTSNRKIHDCRNLVFWFISAEPPPRYVFWWCATVNSVPDLNSSMTALSLMRSRSR